MFNLMSSQLCIQIGYFEICLTYSHHKCVLLGYFEICLTYSHHNCVLIGYFEICLSYSHHNCVFEICLTSSELILKPNSNFHNLKGRLQNINNMKA